VETAGGKAMDFEEHVKILMFFLMALAILFIIAFTFSVQKLWLSALVVIAIVGCIIIVLARSKDEIGKTD
jgi:hypothetical protein